MGLGVHWGDSNESSSADEKAQDLRLFTNIDPIIDPQCESYCQFSSRRDPSPYFIRPQTFNVFATSLSTSLID